MLLANEINESGEPYAEALGYNLADLDPLRLYLPDSVAYTLGINNYEYSRYQLGTIISRSGMGLHVMWAPMMRQLAAMETDPGFDGSFTGSPNGFKEDDELMKTVMHFSMLAHQPPPVHPWPQFAEFIAGDPRLPQQIEPTFATDFASLRWNRDLMDKTLNPAAMGQTLMKQYLWAQDMLGAFHDSSDNTIVADGVVSPDSAGNSHFDPSNNVFYGGNDLDGFIGQILTAEGFNKVFFIVNSLAYDGNTLGAVDPMTYDPVNGIKYFPHKVAVTEEVVDASMPPRAKTFAVTDKSSKLFDQVSLLWGTLSFQNMMDPANTSDDKHLAYHRVFDGDPFPASMSQTGMAGPFDLMKGASMVIFQNIMVMHFNPGEGSFVEGSELDGGQVKQGNSISTVSAGYLLAILKQVPQEFSGTPMKQMALDGIRAQARFLTDSVKNGDGSYANAYTFGSGKDAGPTTVESQAAVIRGLYAAFQATGDSAFLKEANTAYAFLIGHFYSASSKAFYTTLGTPQATYTPFTVAIISGALREARLVGKQLNAPAIYTRFFTTVGDKMQLSEAEQTGETGNDSDGDGIPYITQQANGLPPVFASEAKLSIVTGVDQTQGVAAGFQLGQNYPNPFNPSTTISYSIPTDSKVVLSVYDVLGREVAILVNERQTAGAHSVRFDAATLSSGVYLYTLASDAFRETKRLVLMR
jgi:hypothetical protein